MSFVPTSWRPFAQAAWGGHVAFRGAMSAPVQQDFGLMMSDPQCFGLDEFGQIGTRQYRNIAPSIRSSLVGVSRDGTGAILGLCTVRIFRTADDVKVAETVSDASGNWSVPMMPPGPYYYVEYRVGSPDKAGTSLNTNLPTITN
jgi:hypothetical protein